MEPELKDFGTSFRINISRKPFRTDPYGVVNPSAETIGGQNDPQNGSQNDLQKTDPLAAKIIAMVKANPKIKRSEMAAQANVSPKTIARKLKEMACIRHVGSSKSGHWEIQT